MNVQIMQGPKFIRDLATNRKVAVLRVLVQMLLPESFEKIGVGPKTWHF